MDESRTVIASRTTLGAGLMRPGTATARPAIPTIEGAFRSLASWGFLAQPDLPDVPGPAFLLVALRPQPSLRHFDPEIVRYWTVTSGRGHLDELTRRSTFPVIRAFAWGSIELVDRLGVTNDYLTFGGELTGAVMDDMAILMFTSPAPLLRRGGHSQGWDEVADSVAAFFGRIRGAIDGRSAREQELAAAPSLAIYAAFICDLVAAYRRCEALQDEEPARWNLLVHEERRLRRDHLDEWQRGRQLLAGLGLATT
jgi:hypothetical protein